MAVSLAALIGIGTEAQGVPGAPGGQRASTSHSITLAWTAPSPVGGSGAIGSYNVYRSTTSGGPYTKLSNTASQTFSDTSITAGTKYFYVVTTVDSNGFESVNSAEVSATAIGNPNPPTGVTATAK